VQVVFIALSEVMLLSWRSFYSLLRATVKTGVHFRRQLHNIQARIAERGL
jgi:hypothetical protein